MSVTRHRVSVTMIAREKTSRRIARCAMVINSMGVTAQQASDNFRKAGAVMEGMKIRHVSGNANTGRPISMAEAAARRLQLQVTHPEEPPHMQMVRKQTKRQQKRSARSKR